MTKTKFVGEKELEQWNHRPWLFDVPLLTDKNIIINALKSDRFFYYKVNEIADFFTKNHDCESQVDFLKNTYNDEYTWFFDENDIMCGYKRHLDGLLVMKGSYRKAETKAAAFVEWGEIRSLYIDLINNNELRTEVQKAEYEQISFFDLEFAEQA